MYNPEHTSQMITRLNSELDTKADNSEHILTKKELIEKTISEIKSESDELDRIYDPEWESEIEQRLSKLDELSRKEFYRLRTGRKRKGLLSIREQEELTLEAMEKSFRYRNK